MVLGRGQPRPGYLPLSPTVLGWSHAWHPQGPIHLPTPPRATTYCTPCSHAVEPTPSGGAVPRNVVARGGRVERWALAGARPQRHACPNTVRERDRSSRV